MKNRPREIKRFLNAVARNYVERLYPPPKYTVTAGPLSDHVYVDLNYADGTKDLKLVIETSVYRN